MDKIEQKRSSNGILFGNGSISEVEYHFLKHIISLNNIKRIIEFGPGVSTDAFLDSKCEIHSFEHHPKWFEYFSEKFKHYENVNIYKYNHRKSHIDMNFIQGIFDVAIIDGPPGTGTFSRMLSCDAVSNKTSNIIIHDAPRKGEQETIQTFVDRGWKFIKINKISSGFNTRYGLLYKDVGFKLL